MGKEWLPVFHVSPISIPIAITQIVFCLSLHVPLAATVSFDLPSFDRETKLTCSPDKKGICLQGDAFLNQGLQLTKNQLHTSIASSVGRAVYSQPVQVWDSATGRMADFTAHFSFIIHDLDPQMPSGDGLAFFLSSHPSVIPDNSAGGFLGLFSNFSESDSHVKIVAIEFDTYPNSELDSSSADHIGINVNSIQSVVHFTLKGGIKKRTIANALVEYSTDRHSLSVTLTYDDVSSEGNSNLSHVVDLREFLPEHVSIGFSAATGSLVETHTILSWSFDSHLEVRGNGTFMLVLMVIMAGFLLVGILLMCFLVWSQRKTAGKKEINMSSYTVLPSEMSGKKEEEDITNDAEHVNETGGKEVVTSVNNVLTEESRRGLMKDEDISLDRISLSEVGEGQTEVVNSGSGSLALQDEGQQMEDISLGAESMEEDGCGISESGKISEIVQPSDEREGGTNFKDASTDAGIVVEGGESQIEAPIPMDLLDSWSPKEIPYHVLVTATNNFSEEMTLGRGGFGPVYRGFFSDLGLDVAIKKLSERSEQGITEYMSEVKIITQLRHRNLVKLIGWCHEHGELMLVYEFMPNGSLDHHLFQQNKLLEWPIRYKIALGLANALMYLHDECEPYVLHRDVKSSNVLLDSKFDAKLADFGLARFFNIDITSLHVSRPAGTRGYWAPEYGLMARASRLSDVYSYGIVALEIACGKKAILMTQGEEDNSTTLLVEWVWEFFGKGAILDAADKRLNGNFDRLQMDRLLIMGLWCAHPDHRQRPHIRQASNALLYPETTPLPTLPTRMPPWAFPLAPMQMDTVPLSPLQSSSPTSSFTMSDDPVSSPSKGERRGDRDLDTSQEPTMFRKPKRRLFARFTMWLKRRATTFNETRHDDRVRMITGLKEFSYTELVQATDNFSVKIGQGGFSHFSDVFKGWLISGMNVAVKRFQKSAQSSREDIAQLMTLGRLSHRNLVKLIGWCHDGGQYLLVFEYISNGSLDRYLFYDVGSSTIPWVVRYKVACSLASALCYLHNDWERCVLHRNIKSGSLFLDEEFNLKLAGFAIARETDHGVSLTETRVVGTFGYMAPEYVLSGRYTTASDVYSFGVVALEIACGRRSFQDASTLGCDFLMQWVWRCYADGILFEACDEKLMGNFDLQEMERLLFVGLWCTIILLSVHRCKRCLDFSSFRRSFHGPSTC
uniref:Receptor like protein kinase S.2 n=1 Tax=Anthurium amnicola TaxID=1678845 RepID=A0A1D1YUN9_9ARAE